MMSGGDCGERDTGKRMRSDCGERDAGKMMRGRDCGERDAGRMMRGPMGVTSS